MVSDSELTPAGEALADARAEWQLVAQRQARLRRRLAGLNQLVIR